MEDDAQMEAQDQVQWEHWAHMEALEWECLKQFWQHGDTDRQALNNLFALAAASMSPTAQP